MVQARNSQDFNRDNGNPEGELREDLRIIKKAKMLGFGYCLDGK